MPGLLDDIATLASHAAPLCSVRLPGVTYRLPDDRTTQCLDVSTVSFTAGDDTHHACKTHAGAVWVQVADDRAVTAAVVAHPLVTKWWAEVLKRAVRT